jgi:hypothetical protein
VRGEIPLRALSESGGHASLRLCQILLRSRGPALEPECLQLRHELVHAGALDRVEFGSLTRASKQPNCIPMPRTDACTICQGGDDEGLVLHCDGTCNCAFHAHCVGFRGPVMGDWMCGMCDEATATTCASHE